MKNYLITDGFIFTIPNAEKVVLRFVEGDGITEKLRFEFSYKEFVSKNIFSEEENTNGFAILYMDLPEFVQLPALVLAKQSKFEIGQPISVLAFQQEQQNLSIKSGIVSTFLKHQDGNKYIQFDTSVERGNSGAPLINSETNEVIGIVAHKLSKVNQAFNQMMRIINDNIKTLRGAEGKMNVEHIDPVQVLVATQNQIKHLTKELYKSSTMGQGYAFEIDTVTNYFAGDYDLEKAYVRI